jgi:hypothetical protein
MNAYIMGERYKVVSIQRILVPQMERLIPPISSFPELFRVFSASSVG